MGVVDGSSQHIEQQAIVNMGHDSSQGGEVKVGRLTACTKPFFVILSAHLPSLRMIQLHVQHGDATMQHTRQGASKSSNLPCQYIG